jgi:hypothetical protein
MQEGPNDFSQLSEELSALKEMPEEVQAFIDLKCIPLLASPIGVQALLGIKAAKNAGVIRDRGHCLDLAGDAGKLGSVLGGALAGLIAGETARCACKEIFDSPGSGGGGGRPIPHDNKPPKGGGKNDDDDLTAAQE